MKYLVRLFVITLSLLVTTSLHAEENIAFVDMKKLLNESKAGKSAQETLIKTHESNVSKFKKIEENLKIDESDLLSKKNILKKEEYNEKAEKLRNRVKKYQEERNEKLNRIADQRQEAKTHLMTAIKKILDEYAEKNEIVLILDTKDIILGKKDRDITETIIKKLDKELPSVNLN